MSIKSPTNLELSKKQNKVKIVGFHSGHDTSYCILENGVPIIHEEKERISRIKMDEGDGLSFFFSRYKQDDIKYFTFGSWGARDGTNKEICFSQEADDRMRKIALLNEGAYFEFGHHTCHAANSFYTSNFEEALIIVVDGGGREAGNIRTGLTIHEGKKNKINKIKVFDLREINLGGLYFKATKYIFGLSVRAPNGDQAGTVMAMATFGKPKYQEMFLDFNKNWSALRSISRSSEQERFNVAASLQAFIEKKFHSYISNFINKSDHENLCLGGGVALNCVMMGKIKKWFPQIKNIYIDPVPYDAGLSLGAARYLWHNILGNRRIDSIQNMSPYLGRIYSEAEVKKALASFSDSIKFKKTSSNEVLDKIANQKIVSIFGGRSESGRRALGNRSIIADPRSEKIKAVINEKVKHRQWFRPLSPAILEEEMSKWFEDPIFNPYMSFAVKFKKEVKSKIPAVVHYDGTGRFQTVNSKLNPWFHNFLTKWAKMTGIPILINTSFNDREPIVESPEDAIKCFLKTEIDYLYFYDYGYLVENINT